MSFSLPISHQVFCLSKTNKCSLFSLCDNFRIHSSLRLIWKLQLLCLPDHYCLGKLCSCLQSISFLNYFYYRVYTDYYLPYVQVRCRERPKCSRDGVYFVIFDSVLLLTQFVYVPHKFVDLIHDASLYWFSVKRLGAWTVMEISFVHVGFSMPLTFISCLQSHITIIDGEKLGTEEVIVKI